MTLDVNFRPGVQATTSTDPTAQRTAIAKLIDQFGLKIQLKDSLVSGADLLAIGDQVLKSQGIDPNDLWSLLDDTAGANNQDQIVRPLDAKISARFGTADGIDSNYDRAALSTATGLAFAHEAAALTSKKIEGPNWFSAIFLAIGETFVKLAELITDSAPRTWTYDHIPWASDYVPLGKELASSHAASLTAIQATTGGRQALIEQLQDERPSNVSPAAWAEVIKGVLQGLDAQLPAASSTVTMSDGISSLAARDVIGKAQLRAASDNERSDVQALATTLAKAGLSDTQTDAFAELISDSNKPVNDVTALVQATQAQSAAVRAQIVRGLDTLAPGDVGALVATLSSPAFSDLQLTDSDRVAYLSAFNAMKRPGLRDAVLGLMRTDGWQSLVGSDRQRLLQLLQLAPSSIDTVALIANLQKLPSAVVGEAIGTLLSTGDLTALNKVFSFQYAGKNASLNDALFGSKIFGSGASGQPVSVIQRYLQGLGYVDLLGQVPVGAATDDISAAERTSGVFDAGTTAAVKKFQQDSNLSATGQVDRLTFQAMVLATATNPEPNGLAPLSPMDFRFTTELNLNPPTAVEDVPWSATASWGPNEIAEFKQGAVAFYESAMDTPLHRDCKSLAYLWLVMYARQRNLPLFLTNGGKTFTNKTPRPVSTTVNGNLRAEHIPLNSVPVLASDIQPGDMGIMDWDQSNHGSSFPYQHTYNVIDMVASDPSKTVLLYGDEKDIVNAAPLSAFNKQWGAALSVDDIPEHPLIEAINPDDNDPPSTADEIREMVSNQLIAGGLANPSSDAIDAFIAMVAAKKTVNGKSVDANVTRNAPTRVKATTGEEAFDSMMGRELWADRGLLEASRQQLNAQFGLTLLAAKGRSDGEIDRTGDMMAVIAAAGPDMGLSPTDIDVARTLVRQRGATDANAEVAAQALVAACNASRQARTWNFDKFNAQGPRS